MRSSRLPIAAALLGVAAAACASPAAPDAVPTITPSILPEDVRLDARTDGPATVTTTDLTGNRVTRGRLDVDRAVRVDAGLVPSVLVAAPLVDGVLLVASDRERVVAWVLDRSGVRAVPESLVDGLGQPPTNGRPALVRDGTAWRFAASSGPGDPDWTTATNTLRRDGSTVRFGAAVVDDVLPDARWAVAGTRLAVPVAPTQEYGHAVLGDGIEAGALALADAGTGETAVITFPDGVVLEGTGVVLADLDGDGTPDPVFTLSDAAEGARQAVLLDGVVVEGPAIGQGNRWRHLLGVQDGSLLEVVTPHLARTFQELALREGALTVLHSTPGTIASHAIGSRDLDQVALVDVTGDGRADAIGPADGEPALLRVVAAADGTTVRDVRLPAEQAGNVLGITLDDRAVVATGSADGSVVLLGIDE